ncbi:sensor histidine kinase [Sanguibacteroides justesenii]|uniref:histidine kinase n=1 Tax=Sanguibacteroides justesenii TaxID=1547597 RepID=A0AB34R8V7_9PORP|nr:HAMP domain-containing sensor histidine kinase [Sanguibacteroides justesenii]KIO45438.1 histidine kinase [Sanguibacteroides justesenii]
MRKQQIIILGVVFGLSLFGLILLQTSYFQTAFEVKKEQFDYTVNKVMDEVVDYIRGKVKMNRIAEGNNLLKSSEDGVEDTRMYVDPKRKIASKNDPNLMFSSVLSLIDDDSDVQDVSDFVGRKVTKDNLSTSLAKLQQQIKERLGKDYVLVVEEGNKPERMIEGRMDVNDLYGFIGNTLIDNGIRSSFEFGIKENGKFVLASKNFLSQQDRYWDKRIFPGEKGGTVLYLRFPDLAGDAASSLWMLLPSILITFALLFCSVFCLVVIIRQKKLSVIKNDFINNMTHEFKTPIATISLASQMLKDGAVTNTPETIDRVATIIRDESKRLTYQVERVLQTALFTETRMKLKLKKININDIIEDLLPKFILRVEDKGGKMFGHLEAENDEVLADEVHITNVISNLVDNAIKYCIRAPEISIYTRNRNHEIVISVIDNGIGIAKKDQKLIFERFYRVSTGNLHDVKGFGLGLSYVKKIVEAHGGNIDVESSPDKGSCFDIILPLTSKKQKVKRTLFF